MGKRDKRVAFMNPIAAARARGPAPTSGPTIKDYLGRNRMSLEEAEEKILKTAKQGGSGTLAAWEEELNDNYRKELKKAREKRLAEVAAPTFKKKKKKDKKKSKRQAKARSRSRSPSLSDSDDSQEKQRRKHRKGKKKRKRRHRHRSSSASDSESDMSDDDNDSGLHRRKQKLATSRTEDLAPVPEDSTGAVSEEGLQDNTLAGSGERVPGRKVLLPTPVATTTSTGEREWAGGEGRRDEDARRKGKATKWTGKWDQKRDTA